MTKDIWAEFDNNYHMLDTPGRPADRGNPQPGENYVLTVCVWLFRRVAPTPDNPSGIEILSQKRSQSIAGNPGKWDASAGGHVDVGEDIEDAMVREAKEEIGIDLDKNALLDFYDFTVPGRPILHKTYLYDWQDRPSDFHFDDHEVEEVRWIKYSEFDDFFRTKMKDGLNKDERHLKIMKGAILSYYGNHSLAEYWATYTKSGDVYPDDSGYPAIKTFQRLDDKDDDRYLYAVGIWIYRRGTSTPGNPTGIDVLFQKRSQWVISSPKKWDISAGGHVNQGESLVEAAVREAREEIGAVLDGTKLQPFYNDRSDDIRLHYQAYAYDYTGKKYAFDFSDHEVEDVTWVPYSKIRQFINEKAKDTFKKSPAELAEFEKAMDGNS